MIRNEDELEELLSRPTERDKAVVNSLEGPILILWRRRQDGTYAGYARASGREPGTSLPLPVTPPARSGSIWIKRVLRRLQRIC